MPRSVWLNILHIIPGNIPFFIPSGEPSVSGDFWGSQEGCQGRFRESMGEEWVRKGCSEETDVLCPALEDLTGDCSHPRELITRAAASMWQSLNPRGRQSLTWQVADGGAEWRVMAPRFQLSG